MNNVESINDNNKINFFSKKELHFKKNLYNITIVKKGDKAWQKY